MYSKGTTASYFSYSPCFVAADIFIKVFSFLHPGMYFTFQAQEQRDLE